MREITGKTKIVGVIGDPVEHSRSPQMHNAAFEALNLDFVYVPFRVPRGEVRDAIEGLKSLGVIGINVTIPHKREVLALADQVSEEAKLIGAANTLTFRHGRILADNTDGRGFIKALKAMGAGDLKGRKALVLGAGGTARAICVALAREKVGEVTVANRTIEKAEELVNLISESFDEVEVKSIPLKGERLAEEIASSDLLVNTTSVGMKPDDPMLIRPEWMHPGLMVYDVIYTPPETKLIMAAKGKGLRCSGGIDMLVFQGAISFRIWTGITPPVEVMRATLMKSLGVTDG
ncbi:TPA: shikimate dehydrogenase [Candidatus Poribacteria bacterium]|nr:shikimate dehydrogenase [Candidatus Poribacteria bacterium]HEX29365.1 shikimate dehydrogenase [Candidatus Poribacteria bacterium]